GKRGHEEHCLFHREPGIRHHLSKYPHGIAEPLTALNAREHRPRVRELFQRKYSHPLADAGHGSELLTHVGRAQECRETRRRGPPQVVRAPLAFLPVFAGELAYPLPCEFCPRDNRTRARLEPDHPHGEVMAAKHSVIPALRIAHGKSPSSSNALMPHYFCRFLITGPRFTR